MQVPAESQIQGNILHSSDQKLPNVLERDINEKRMVESRICNKNRTQPFPMQSRHSNLGSGATIKTKSVVSIKMASILVFLSTITLCHTFSMLPNIRSPTISQTQSNSMFYMSMTSESGKNIVTEKLKNQYQFSLPSRNYSKAMLRGHMNNISLNTINRYVLYYFF